MRRVMISCADSGSTGVPYFAASGLAAASAATRSGGSAPMSESGGMRRVAASGDGTPLGERTVTSASPMASEVSVRPTS